MSDPPTQVTNKVILELQEFGIKPFKIYRNLPVPDLVNLAIERNEGILTSKGSLAVKTGKYTGRSPHDRFIVEDEESRNTVDWGKINHKFSKENFAKIAKKMKDFLEGQDLFVFDGFVGAEKQGRVPIRIINDNAWQNLFARQLFIRPTQNEISSHNPEFTLLGINNFKANPDVDGTKSDVFVLINLSEKLVMIGGTTYAGEMKKAIFSIMNYLLPTRNVFPMHCSANVGKPGDTALFFGLSGTGKTTLSADPNRMLIGDDEHGWSDKGIFNFEGGCYAKCINLSEKAEPQIWNAIKYGAVLENVVINPKTLKPDFDDGTLTENTRAAYPLDNIPTAIFPSVGGHPKVIIFLTADALGVLPPISRLTKEGAMFHFMSGYTSKLAGTERGIKEPTAVFSECFGAPFMPHPAQVYAKMLGEKIREQNTKVFLINTGWSGGPYGVGSRIEIKYSRAMVTAAISGSLDVVKYKHDSLFNLDIPAECEGVPSEILDPKNTWADVDSYGISAKKLAQMFIDNFEKFKDVSLDIRNAGPYHLV